MTLLAFASIIHLRNLFYIEMETKQSEIKMFDSEEKFRTMVDFSYDWEMWLLPDGSYEYISPSCERITGYTPEEFVADPDLLLQIIHPEDRQMMIEHQSQHLCPETEKAELEFHIISKSGQVRWIWHECSSVFKQDGTWIGRRISNRDITDKHEAEIILQRERNMFLHGPVVTFTWQNSENWPVEQVSGNVFRILGYSAKEFLEGSILYASLVHPDDLDRVTSEVTTCSSDNSVSFIHEPYRLVTRRGNIIWVLDTTTIIRNDQGDITHYQGYLVDISEQKRQEQIALESAMQQEQLNRLESLKTMAGAIAHRFNNAMMAVQGNLDLLTNTLLKGSGEYEMASNAVEAARGSSLVGSMMLSYVGQRPLQLREISLFDLARECSHTIKALSRPSVSLTIIPPAQELYCSMDQQQIQEVIENILTNAVESLENSTGTIEMSFGTEYCTTDSFPIAFQAEDTKDGMYAFCQIKDTGQGIRPKNLPRIFEPFYTTRFVGRGLGLALTVGVMRKHGGAVTVASILTKGTTVKVLLPVISSSQQTEPSSQGVQNKNVQLSGDILLVDDDAIILGICEILLEQLGFTVHTAINGHEAVDKVRKQDIDFCAAVMDISMPIMDGIEAMEIIRTIDPAMPILLISGYSENDFPMPEKQGNRLDCFLRKPFQLADLRKSLEELLF